MQAQTADQWKIILTKCGVKTSTADKWAEYFEHAVIPEVFSQPDSVDDFLVQILHESARLEALEENLNYTPQSLLKLFGRRISEQQAMQFGRVDGKHRADQVAIANIIYGGEWGRTHLGNTQVGDGYNFRGSGPLQLTGRSNFAIAEKATGLPLLKHPELVRKVGVESLTVCITWWNGHIPDAALGDLKRIRKIVNGGLLGLDDTVKIAGALKSIEG